MTGVACAWLGRVPYGEALSAQRERREAVVGGRAPEAFWGLEHPPVVTLGRRGGEVDVASLAARGVEVVATERGGLATYHGPGQLVGYLIVDLASRGMGIKATVCGLELGLIRWLGARGLMATRQTGQPGVWVGSDKIAAVGLHIARGVSLHGFALNLHTPLEAFTGFVPCGLRDAGITRMADHVAGAPTPAEAWATVAESVLGALVDVARPAR